MSQDTVVGKYILLNVQGKEYRVFYEEAGRGVPLLCLHTAGADSRQYQHLLRTTALTSDFRVIAFDLPYHGRSFPTGDWWEEPYQLSQQWYLDTIMSFIDALGIDDVAVMGCSMGGNICLELAHKFPNKFRGVIALEAAARTPGRLSPFLNHPHVNSGEIAGCYVYGLMAPQSSEKLRRQAWWIYSQGAPGVYYGDLYFYSQEWDASSYISEIDTTRCPVYMFTGEYDYSCTAEMSKETSSKISGAQFTLMENMGHFPMCENPELLLHYVQPTLQSLLGN